MGNTVINADDLKEWVSDNEFEVDQPPPPAGEFSLIWPAPYPVVVTQYFGRNPQFYPGQKGHEGIDIRAPNNVPIYAGADGTVYRVELDPNSGPYGIHVRIEHSHPKGPFQSVYAHFRSAVVEIGDEVLAGQEIGKADNTGNSSGAHLHLMLKKENDGSDWLGMGDIVDPTPYMADLFPGDGWVVDIGGNFRTSPEVANNLIRFIPANSIVHAHGFMGDWWKIEFEGIVGWFWTPYKLISL